jgi:hypothetical protein
MPGLVIVILGISSLALYFSFKIFSDKCNPDFPIEIENHINTIQDNEIDEEAPPKYEDIVNSN